MKKIKVILIDAFKPEYLKYAPYLSSLTQKYQWGELVVPFGHEGASEMLFKGYNDKIALIIKSDNSSLKWTRYFSWLGRFGVDSMINFIRLFKKEELFRTGNIPLRKLYKFDFSVKKPAYSGLPVEFKYFGELDRIGHEYGTKSQEIINAIKKIDENISKLNFDLVFSDHGMVDIANYVAVPETKNCFIDSDMARYWGNKEELLEIKKKLPLKYGKIINYRSPAYGDLIFLANTGVLISPNYWQGNRRIKGMHGYSPEHKDMKAIYILKKEGNKKNLHTEELHKIVEELIREK
jgi:hypothetical protein